MFSPAIADAVYRLSPMQFTGYHRCSCARNPSVARFLENLTRARVLTLSNLTFQPLLSAPLHTQVFRHPNRARGTPSGFPRQSRPPSSLNRPPKGPDGPRSRLHRRRLTERQSKPQRGEEERQTPGSQDSARGGLSGSARQAGPTGRKRPPAGAKTRTNRRRAASAPPPQPGFCRNRPKTKKWQTNSQ